MDAFYSKKTTIELKPVNKEYLETEKWNKNKKNNINKSKFSKRLSHNQKYPKWSYIFQLKCLSDNENNDAISRGSGIPLLENRVKKPSYALWRHKTLSYNSKILSLFNNNQIPELHTSGI